MHDPDDVDALVDLLSAGLEDDAWRESARVAGLAQARRFSWDKCARETLAVYKAVSEA